MNEHPDNTAFDEAMRARHRAALDHLPASTRYALRAMARATTTAAPPARLGAWAWAAGGLAAAALAVAIGLRMPRQDASSGPAVATRAPVSTAPAPTTGAPPPAVAPPSPPAAADPPSRAIARAPRTADPAPVVIEPPAAEAPVTAPTDATLIALAEADAASFDATDPTTLLDENPELFLWLADDASLVGES